MVSSWRYNALSCCIRIGWCKTLFYSYYLHVSDECQGSMNISQHNVKTLLGLRSYYFYGGYIRVFPSWHTNIPVYKSHKCSSNISIFHNVITIFAFNWSQINKHIFVFIHLYNSSPVCLTKKIFLTNGIRRKHQLFVFSSHISI